MIRLARGASELSLGIGGSNHDFSSALADGDRLVVAIEDERLQRVKHGLTGWDAAPGRDAALACLAVAGIGFDALGAIVCVDDMERPVPWVDWSRVKFLNHHMAHAAASYFPSPFERATLLVADGHGSPLGSAGGLYEVETISIGWAEGTTLTLAPLQTGVQKMTSSMWRYVAGNSPGALYEVVSMLIGFGDNGQGKTMGLAAYGTPRLVTQLREFVEIGDDGRFGFDAYGGIADWVTRALASSRNAMQVRADIAYALQEVFGDAIVAAAREAYRQAPSPALCVGGGCALNTLANSRILAETDFRQLFIYPAAADNGLAVGAAFHGAHVLLGRPRGPKTAGWRGRAAYTGREYGPEEVDAAIASASVSASVPADVAAEVARAIAGGETVAVCRGRSEIGPRALGNRSLLASPATTRMRDHINLNVKGRESFRPLAPVVAIEQVDEWFEGVEESPYMLLVARVRPEARDRLAGVCHVDGTARVQTVRVEDNPFLHRLLGLVGELTGVPIVVNTSLNLRGEPIVETPADAMRLFVAAPVDVLVLGDRIVRKYTPWHTPSPPDPINLAANGGPSPGGLST